jgi:hypothetical protein
MAKEYTGVLLIMATILRSTMGRRLLSQNKTYFGPTQLRDWTMLVETLLEWEAWLKSDQMELEHVEAAKQKHRYIKKAHPDKSLKLCDFATYRRNNPGKGDHPKPPPNVRYVDHTTHGNKWTILNGGQQKNGSWKDKAIARFVEIKALAANGRQHTNCEALEEVACGIIR